MVVILNGEANKDTECNSVQLTSENLTAQVSQTHYFKDS